MKVCRSHYYTHLHHCPSSSFFRITFSVFLLLTYLLSPAVQARAPRLPVPFSEQHRKSYTDPTAHHSISSLAQTVNRLLQGGGDEEKAQMGSRPPTCDSKCNNCKPCEAVQVPTTRTPKVKLPASSDSDKNKKKDNQGNLTASAQLSSNYKPEDWKCTCGNKFFNP